MPEQLTSALLLASWTSIIWAPLTMAGTVWMRHYQWPATAVVGTVLAGLWGWSFAFQSSIQVCRSAGAAEFILCQEEGMAFGLLRMVMAGAAFFALGFFLLGRLIRRHAEVKLVGA